MSRRTQYFWFPVAVLGTKIRPSPIASWAPGSQCPKFTLSNSGYPSFRRESCIYFQNSAIGRFPLLVAQHKRFVLHCGVDAFTDHVPPPHACTSFAQTSSSHLLRAVSPQHVPSCQCPFGEEISLRTRVRSFLHRRLVALSIARFGKNRIECDDGDTICPVRKSNI